MEIMLTASCHHLSRYIYADQPLVYLCFTCLIHLNHPLYFSRLASKSTPSLMRFLMLRQDGMLPSSELS